jgi:Gpi18-like mannosyltransferase
MIKKHTAILLVLSVALVIKLFFSGFPPFKTDMDSWIGWGDQMYVSGPQGFYGSGVWTDYAPGYMYFLWLTAVVKNIFFSNASREATEFLYKFIPILFDILSGWMIYKILDTVLPKDRKSFTKYIPETFSLIYLISPFTTFNGAIWGQADSVYTFFILHSLFYLVSKRYYLSVIIYVVAAVIKPQAIALAPLYFIVLTQPKDWMMFLKSVLIGFTTFHLLTIPFWGIIGLERMYALMQYSIGVYPYNSINAFNLWGAFGFWQKDTLPFIWGLSMQTVGTALYVVSVVGILFGGYRLLKTKGDLIRARNIFLLGAFSVFSFSFLLTRMHDRYMFPALSLMLLFIGIQCFLYVSEKGAALWKFFITPSFIFYIIIGILHTINLYYVYIMYLYFTEGVPAHFTLYYVISNNIRIFSYAMTVCYVGFLLLLLYYGTHRKRELA